MPNTSRVARNKVDRRAFLRTSGALTAATFAAPAIVRGRNLNEQFNVAVIGAGGRGARDSKEVADAGASISALVDVSEKNLGFAKQRYPKAAGFTDFRKLYEQPQLFDAVIVATCEHTHALATLPALKLNKHVYCEKPLTHDVWEARVIRKAARSANVTTQQGTQMHASENYRRTVELIQSGVIGPVHEVHVWVSRAWGWHKSIEAAKAANDRYLVIDTPQGSSPAPRGLDWDLWVGPAERRPFHNDYYPGPKWYRFWDFGNGTMSDLGSHRNDLPFWALELEAPDTIEAFGPAAHPGVAPASMHVKYEFPQRGKLPAVEMHWYQGTEKPKIWRDRGIPQWGDGCLFIGAEGMLLADYGKHVLLPEEKFKDVKLPDKFLPRVKNHHAEWVDACRAGKPASCDFEYAGLLTEANHLGNVAFRVGKKLEWDTQRLAVTNTSEAEPYLRRPYHNGWKLE